MSSSRYDIVDNSTVEYIWNY